MKRTAILSCFLWLLMGCSGITHFVYYEPQANGWKLRHTAPGEPDDEVIFHGDSYAITVSAMTLSANLKSVGPPFLPIVPALGVNDQANQHEPDVISIYLHFFMQEEMQVRADFALIKLRYGDRDVSAYAVYKVPHSTLESKEAVSMSQVIHRATKYEQTHGQFPEYQLSFSWTSDKPDTFSIVIPANAIRIDGESIPATVINFKKKTISKYQYFP